MFVDGLLRNRDYLVEFKHVCLGRDVPPPGVSANHFVGCIGFRLGLEVHGDSCVVIINVELSGLENLQIFVGEEFDEPMGVGYSEWVVLVNSSEVG
jgi:hypothetical protein